MVCKWPGSAHDSFIFNHSGLATLLHSNKVDGWLLGDSGYACRAFLLTPVTNPSSKSEEKYNKCHILTRNTIERAFGLCKSRFRCLHKTTGCLPFTPRRCASLVKVAFLLHNFCINQKLPLPDGDAIPLDEDCMTQPQPQQESTDGHLTRRLLIESKFR